MNDIVLENTIENYFLIDRNKVKIRFSYEYFSDFIKKNKLESIFLNKLHINKESSFDFFLNKIHSIDKDEKMENWDFLWKLYFDKNPELSEWLFYLGNNWYKTKWFLFFPNYKKDGQIINDFSLIWAELNEWEKIDLLEYVDFSNIYKRDWIIICIEL